MTKNQQQKQVSNAKLKKGKIKRKQMFNELQTINQQKINQMDNIDEQYNPQKIQQQSLQYIGQKHQRLKQKTIEQVCQAVNLLMSKNKVGIKNAFDVPIIDILDIISYNKDETDNSWKTLSATLQNDYKIYGYRVDAIHSITYSILNIMSRRQAPVQQEMKNSQGNNKSSTNLQNLSFLDLKQGFLDEIENAKTFLQKDHKSINISSIDNNLSTDPILQRTKRLFDQQGLKGMLTNNINISNNLQLPLYSRMKHEAYSTKLSQIGKIDINLIQNPIKVFQSVQKIKSDIIKILKLQEKNKCTNKQLQKIWKNVQEKQFDISDWNQNKKVWLDIQDQQNNFQMMIDQNSQIQSNINIKFIGDFIRMKNPIKKVYTDKDIEINSQKWLNDIDRKYLGIKTQSKVQLTIKPKCTNYDDIMFDLELQERDQILRKQSATKQINQQIQDRFLTTIRPMNEFKIQKILTLRQQPQTQLQAIQQQMCQQNNYQHFLQRQIDIKRQNTSIKQMKATISQQIFSSKSSSFNQTYTSYCQKQGDISPALCFLTLLHLANQNNLIFQSTKSEMDFFIKTQTK